MSFKWVFKFLVIVLALPAFGQTPKNVAEYVEEMYQQAFEETLSAEWARGEPARDVWRLFKIVKDRGLARRHTEMKDFNKSSISNAIKHIQGVARLADDRFVIAHSTYADTGHWYVTKLDSKDTEEFKFGTSDHPSPLQASGQLVFAPLTTDEKMQLFIRFDKSRPFALRIPDFYFGSPARSGITYHHARNVFYYLVGDRLYVSPSAGPVERVVVSGKKPVLGQGGGNLVYDETNQNIYVFSFRGSRTDGETEDVLSIQGYSLSDDGRTATYTGSMRIPFPHYADDEGTDWDFGGGMRVNEDSIEIYKTDQGGGPGNQIYISVYRFPYSLIPRSPQLAAPE